LFASLRYRLDVELRHFTVHPAQSGRGFTPVQPPEDVIKKASYRLMCAANVNGVPVCAFATRACFQKGWGAAGEGFGLAASGADHRPERPEYPRAGYDGRDNEDAGSKTRRPKDF